MVNGYSSVKLKPSASLTKTVSLKRKEFRNLKAALARKHRFTLVSSDSFRYLRVLQALSPFLWRWHPSHDNHSPNGQCSLQFGINSDIESSLQAIPMKVSLDWLSQHVDVSDYTTQQLEDLLTFAGVEVEEIEEKTIHDNVVVAEVLDKQPHPDADKLSVCQVKHGDSSSQIVCGAKNFKVGDKVPLAMPGTVMPGGMKIKKGKLRGVESQGMMCSGQELGIPSDVDGLLILENSSEVGTQINKLYPSDTQFTVEITPNRPDWLSHLGMAREVAGIVGKDLKSDPIAKSDSPTRPASDSEIKIEANSACPFYTARVIKSVKVGPSPAWLQGRLESVGLRPINNIVDITNFVLMEVGQPLHAFDLTKVDGHIHVRLAQQGEKLVALDGETYELSDTDTVIADSKKALAIGGVMGGEDSGVVDGTTDILLESAYFEPPRIRRTSHRLFLSSDSSYRFERGVDPQQVLGASELATKLILEIAGGEAEPEIQIAGSPPKLSGEVELDHAFCRKVLGCEIADDRIVEILSGLGLEGAFNAGISIWKIPSYRLDLIRPIDLVEEVARIHGLDNIPSSHLAISSPPRAEDGVYDVAMNIKKRLVSMGFCETPTLSMVSEGQVNDGVAGHERTSVPIKNPLGTDYGVLRTTLLSGLAVNELSSGLLNVASRNANLGAPSARVFEVGNVYSDKGEETLISLLIAGNASERTWLTKEPRKLTVHDMRGVVESLLPDVDINMNLVEDQHLPLAAQLSVRMSGNETRLGVLGQCSPTVARKIGYEAVLVAELKLKTVQKLLTQPTKYTDISPYPAITRDVAMEIDGTVPNQSVSQFFQSYKEPLLESFALFDVFADPTGEKLDASKKSLAYTLTYRSQSKTLETKTVDKAHAKVLAALQNKLGVSIR